MDRISVLKRAQRTLNKMRRTGVTIESMTRFIKYLLDIHAWNQLDQILVSDVVDPEAWSTEYVLKRLHQRIENGMKSGYSKKAAYGLEAEWVISVQWTTKWHFDWAR